MFYIIFFTIAGVAVGYVLYKLLAVAWPLVVGIAVFAVGYQVYVTTSTDGGAAYDKAYYCNILGTDTSTQEWKNVIDWSTFDERNLKKTADDYAWSFRSMSCETAQKIAADDPARRINIDYTHSKLGYIRRYYFYRDDNVVGLYRDNDQFLWQRALTLRIDEDCTLNRESGQCIEVPSEERCSWDAVKTPSNSRYGQCQYDTTGRSKYHKIVFDNFIVQSNW